MQSAVNLVIKRFAGHSKWMNIRHIKAQKDNERGKLFTRYSMQIKVAIQEGSSVDPKLNLKLNQIIEQAKRSNMPVATIQNVIKSVQSNKDKSQNKIYHLSVKGPGSCLLLCEAFTPNLAALKMQMGTILKKNQGKLLDTNVKSLFDHKGVIDTEIPTELNKNESLEAATTDAILCEADDVEFLEDEKLLRFFCDPNRLNKVQKSLESKGYKIKNSSDEFIPLKTVELSDKDMELSAILIEKLESLEHIVKVYDNIS